MEGIRNTKYIERLKVPTDSGENLQLYIYIKQLENLNYLNGFEEADGTIGFYEATLYCWQMRSSLRRDRMLEDYTDGVDVIAIVQDTDARGQSGRTASCM